MGDILVMKYEGSTNAKTQIKNEHKLIKMNWVIGKCIGTTSIK